MLVGFCSTLTPAARPPSQWVNACRASLARSGQERLALAQLHWSTANYAPLQERLMWDGLVAIYNEACCC